MAATSNEEGARGARRSGHVRPDVDALIEDPSARIDRDWTTAQDAINNLVRLQTAQGLAAQFLERPRPYEGNALLSATLEKQLLDKISFIQKPPHLLRFYKHLLFATERAPTSTQ